ncbi:E6 [Canis familiaris papillomavirus 16]|uniref:Protein E6 n=1 Tax=Canis familiaris papillomavirus 16 TaxID=1619253 RepID=A0A0C5L0H3_9PAPI|nr:E6 [Canis familiaris papillomavirus 16]AJP70541.1 E6 [Canis familiaris papillomavirus 16]AVZ46183.1 E6 [Chipapillomavirus 2]
MARPWSVAGLCSQWGATLNDIPLPCVFCGELIDFDDKVAFDFKGLQITWKNRKPHACCTRCARVVCRAEVSEFTEEEVSAWNFYNRVGAGIIYVPVRCTVCLAVVTNTQKLAALQNRQNFKKVRGRWRTECSNCAGSEDDWERRYFKGHSS